MAKVTIDGVTFDLPDSGMSGREIKKAANLPAESTAYLIQPNGEHRIIDDGENVRPQEGDRFGSVTRFRAAWGRKLSATGKRLDRKENRQDDGVPMEA
jgi:hypothetical protein